MLPMRANERGPSRLPFHGAEAPFETRSFEEAVARLMFLAERGWPAGWLFGPSGCGKTSVLRAVRQELRRSGSEALFISLCGVDGDEFWPTIATALGARDTEYGLAARKAVRALLVASSMIDRPVMFLLDDADRGGVGLWDQLAAFVRMAEGVTPSHTVVVATACELPASDLARRIDLRADVSPFAAEDVAAFVAHRLRQGDSKMTFTAEAIAELFTATAGVPAAVGRFADLAIVAAEATEAQVVDVPSIRSAVSDLRPSNDEPLVPLAAAPLPARFSA
jgi:type II secretory pathway predicted ATPase ExeA